MSMCVCVRMVVIIRELRNTFFKVHKLLRLSLCRAIDGAKRPSVLLNGNDFVVRNSDIHTCTIRH